MKRKVLKILSVFMAVVVISSITIGVYAEESHKNEFVKAYGYTYYYNEFGNLAKNTVVEVDGELYYMDYSGQMQTGWVRVPYDVKGSGSIDLMMNSEQYVGNRYFRANGTMARNTTIKFDKLVYGFNEYGKQVIDDFALIKGKKYKFDKDGNKQKATLTSVDEVEKYLNAFYSTIKMPNGEFKVKWYVSEGDKKKKAYDYQIYANIEPEDWSKDYHKTRSVLSDLIWDLSDKELYSDEQREQGNKALQDVILKAVRSVIKLEPEAKVEAYFYEKWWDKSETWRVYTNSSNSQTWLRCQNYETSDSHAGEYGYTTYKRSKKTKLHWVGSSTPCYARSY